MGTNWIFIAFGIVFFLVGYIGWYLQKKFFERAIIVSGRVVDYEESENSEGTPMYRPIVNYEFRGETRTVAGAIRTSWKPKVGAPCQVGIDPINPQRVRLRSKSSYVFWWMFMGFGVVFLFIGVLG